MMHNNFRKLVRRLLASKTNTSAGWPFIYDYTDLNGYTGSAFSTDGLAMSIYTSKDTVCANPFVGPITLSSKTRNQMLTDTTRGCFIFAAVGNSEENEADYTLGAFIDNASLHYTNTITRDYNLIISTVITNLTNSDISFNEIALIFHAYSMYGTSASDGGNKWNNAQQPMNMLLIKEQLDTPQIIPAGGSISIAYNLFGNLTIQET